MPQPSATVALPVSSIGTPAVTLAENETVDMAGAPDRLEEILPEAPLVIHFWATWCVPCRGELPELEQFRDNLDPELNTRLIVISVDKRPRADVRRFLENDMDLPGFQTYLVDPEEAGSRFKITGYPLTLFLRADGTIVRRISGSAPWPAKAFQRQAIEHLGPGG